MNGTVLAIECVVMMAAFGCLAPRIWIRSTIKSGFMSR